jgi:hypothetical protein
MESKIEIRKVIILIFKLYSAFLLIYQGYRASFQFNYSCSLYPCFPFPFLVIAALSNGFFNCIDQAVLLNLLSHVRLPLAPTLFSCQSPIYDLQSPEQTSTTIY